MTPDPQPSKDPVSRPTLPQQVTRSLVRVNQSGNMDAGLGQGMEMALSSGVFLVLGWILDSWLGLFPILSISLVLFATIGQGLKLWFVYNHRMVELERERRRQSTAHFEQFEDRS